jgi:uncharacterized protein (TIGR03067 family)
MWNKLIPFTILFMTLLGCDRGKDAPHEDQAQPDIGKPELVMNDQEDPVVNEDRKRLEGTWLLVKVERDGGAVPFPNGFRYTFAGDKMITGTSEFSVKLDYCIDPKADPKWLDATDTERNPYSTGRQIYKLEGDRLIVCMYVYGRERPTTFTTSKGDGRTLYVLQRVPAGKE